MHQFLKYCLLNVNNRPVGQFIYLLILKMVSIFCFKFLKVMSFKSQIAKPLVLTLMILLLKP